MRAGTRVRVIVRYGHTQAATYSYNTLCVSVTVVIHIQVDLIAAVLSAKQFRDMQWERGW